MLKGIDVAKWQGNIDWKRVKAAGVQFAILKAIDKSGSVEGKFEKNYIGAVSQNIPVGVYNYSYATSVEKAVQDANNMLKAIKGKDIKVKVWLDVEDQCQKKLGSRLLSIINAYKEVITNAGYEFGVYTGLSFYNSYIKPYAKNIDCDFWIARYPSSKTMTLSQNPSTSKKPSIMHNLWGWQYSSKGSVNGISGAVDMNICYANISEKKLQSTTVYFPRYYGNTVSIVSALNSLGITSTYAYRKQIAKANGIKNYAGLASQNTIMLNLLKKGKLERP